MSNKIFLKAINSTIGLSYVEINNKNYLHYFPYTNNDFIEINSPDILTGEGWFIYNKKKYIKSNEYLNEFLISELRVSSIFNLLQFQRTINQGKPLTGTDENKVDLMINKIESQIEFEKLNIRNAMILSSISFIYERTFDQNNKIKELFNKLTIKENGIELLPKINNELKKSINIDQLLDYIEGPLVEQGRLNIAKQIIAFLHMHEKWFSELEFKSIKRLYSNLRENIANKNGYSTYSTHKKNTGKTKRIISKKG